MLGMTSITLVRNNGGCSLYSRFSPAAGLQTHIVACNEVPKAFQPVGFYTTKSATHGQRDAIPMVTLLDSEHHCPSTKVPHYTAWRQSKCV